MLSLNLSDLLVDLKIESFGSAIANPKSFNLDKYIYENTLRANHIGNAGADMPRIGKNATTGRGHSAG